jgi:hypothetical protein
MQSRVYTDRTGLTWQVFQVQRSSLATAAVTPGREAGWLTFVSAKEKRRLAPPPAGWDLATLDQLEDLCSQATLVPFAATTNFPTFEVADATSVEVRREARPVAELLSQQLRDGIRDEARRARADKRPVIQAMTALRATLETQGISAHSDEFREARKLFLNVFYFEHTR